MTNHINCTNSKWMSEANKTKKNKRTYHGVWRHFNITYRVPNCFFVPFSRVAHTTLFATHFTFNFPVADVVIARCYREVWYSGMSYKYHMQIAKCVTNYFIWKCNRTQSLSRSSFPIVMYWFHASSNQQIAYRISMIWLYISWLFMHCTYVTFNENWTKVKPKRNDKWNSSSFSWDGGIFII